MSLNAYYRLSAGMFSALRKNSLCISFFHFFPFVSNFVLINCACQFIYGKLCLNLLFITYLYLFVSFFYDIINWICYFI